MRRCPILAGLLLAASLLALAPSAPAAAEGESVHAAARLSLADRQAADALAADYMRFLGEAKIPLRRTRYLRKLLEAQGFRPYTPAERWAPGARFYLSNRERALIAWVVGKQPLSEGVRLIGAHLDSPRLDLRIRPLKTAEGMLMLKTEPYGGIKRYQWTNLPLALVGQVAKADGSLIDVAIGDAPGDPVFVLPDLAPHVDKEFRARTADAVFKGDELNALAATLAVEKGGVKRAFLDEIARRYGVSEEDFVSAELSFVPVQRPLEVGVDRSLIGAYGQDDGLCSFLATRALVSLSGAPPKTAMALLVDHEEVGNTNATGVRSRFFAGTLDRLAAREAGKDVARDVLSSVLERSEVLSADVSQAINPNFPSTEDPQTTAHLGEGFTLKTMKPGFDASPLFRGRVRRLLAQKQIPWQTYAYKVDGGGGATIGAELQELNMDVLDVGAPLLAMHGTFEVSAKADVYALRRFFEAFYGQP